MSRDSLSSGGGSSMGGDVPPACVSSRDHLISTMGWGGEGKGCWARWTLGLVEQGS